MFADPLIQEPVSYNTCDLKTYIYILFTVVYMFIYLNIYIIYMYIRTSFAIKRVHGDTCVSSIAATSCPSKKSPHVDIY